MNPETGIRSVLDPEQEPRKSSRPSARVEPPVLTQPGRILVVEDEPLILQWMVQELTRQNHIPLSAATGAEALQIARTENPELILLDVGLPDGDGYKLCRTIKTDVALQHVPIIMITGQADSQTQFRSFEAGANDFLGKPVSMQLLELRIRALLRYRRALVELQKAQAELERRVKERTEALIVANEELSREVRERQRAEEIAQQSTARLRKMIEHMDAVYLHDRIGNFEMVNQRACDQLGYSRTELMALKVVDIAPKYDQETLNELWNRLAPGEPISVRSELKRKDGTLFLVEVRAGLLDLDGRPMILSLVQDITGRLRQEEALRASEERYALAARGANDGLWDWDLKTDKIFFSARWKQMLGFAENEMSESKDEWFVRIHPDDRFRLRHAIDSHLDGASSEHFEIEYRIQNKAGAYRWMLCRGTCVRDGAGVPTRMAGSQTDISKRKTAELQLVHDALHDTLTGIPNRALFIDRLGQSIERTERFEGVTLAVLFLDVDRFKLVSASFGRKLGDMVLTEIARRLERSARPGDTVARLAGDEFAILLNDLQSLEEAEAESARFQQELARPFLLAGQEVFISISVGIAHSKPPFKHPEDILRDADTAMHRAKALGKDRHEVFHSGLHAKVVSLLQLETDLRKALTRQDFALQYQPIISLKTGRISGFEALVRWQRIEGKMVPPVEFIPLAEETRMIVPMTWWVLQEACQRMVLWQARHETMRSCYMNVNLSGKVFVEPTLITQVGRILNETGLDPQWVKLEITESALMEHSESSAAVLAGLRNLNAQLVLDDFGTGYSSLSYLHRFPVNMLKIDRSFINMMGGEGKNFEIVRTIITLAHEVGMEVVAEGVETAEQLKLLKTMNCEYAQGYFISRPLKDVDVEKLIQSNPQW